LQEKIEGVLQKKAINVYAEREALQFDFTRFGRFTIFKKRNTIAFHEI